MVGDDRGAGADEGFLHTLCPIWLKLRRGIPVRFMVVRVIRYHARCLLGVRPPFGLMNEVIPGEKIIFGRSFLERLMHSDGS